MSIIVPIHEEETYVIELDYTDAMPPGATSPESAVLEAHEWVGGKADTDVTVAFLVSDDGTIDGNLVKFQFQDPEEGKTYRVKVKVTFDDGQVTVSRILLQVEAV